MIFENIAGVARPVRMAANSSLACSTALSIFSSASKRVSSITGSSRLLAGFGGAGCGDVRGSASSRGDQGADLLAGTRAHDGVVAVRAEDQHRKLVLLAEAERGLVG